MVDGPDSSLLLQVEFYFSDSNVPRDVFLISKIQEDPEVHTSSADPCLQDSCPGK